ncbi:hypothetical protein D3C76_1767220 [compost metagenome]
MIARIVNQRRAGIRHQRDVRPFFQFGHQRFGFLLLIVIVQSEHFGANGEVLQQQAGVASVFGGN